MSSSPFELFRRNLKPLMVFLTGLALFAFVVLPVLDSYMRQNAGVVADDVVASYDGTTLKRGRIEYFTRNHQATIRFLRRLAEETINRGGSPKTAGFSRDPQTGQIETIGINENPSFGNSVRTLMLANEAQDAGFELDDAALRVWLEQFTDQLISTGDINAILMQETQNQMGRPHLYEQLRNHLLANVYLGRGYAGLYMGDSQMTPALLTPQEQWENFLKLNQNAVVNAYGVMVNDYLAQTNKTPGEEDILAIFEEGKRRPPSDFSDEPAFFRPYEAEFEYLVAVPQTFIDRQVAQLTEEEIRAEYERRLQGGEFQVPDLPAEPVDGEPVDGEPVDGEPVDGEPVDGEPVDGEPVDGEPLDGEPVSEEATTADAAATAEPGSEDQPNDQPEDQPMVEETPEENPEANAVENPEANAVENPEENADTPETKEAATTEEAATEEAATEEAATEEPSETADEVVEETDESEPATESPDENDQSQRESRRAVKLVIAQDETEGDDAAEAQQPAEETPQQPSAADAADDAADTSPAADDAADSSPADDDTAEPANATEGDQPAEANEANAADATATSATLPFEEVRDQIAEDLARPAALQDLNAALAKANATMKTYFNQRAIAQGSESKEVPESPKLSQLAEELGLQYEKIGPYTRQEIRDEPIANSVELGSQFGMQASDFTLMMYGAPGGQFQTNPQPVFAPIRTTDPQTAKQYVSWKIEEQEAYVPQTLEEVREEVVMAIRMREARELARKAAQQIAKQAEQSGSLEEVIPDDKSGNYFEGLGPFSWMNSLGFQGATIGNVRELDAVGEEFMREVFTTETGNFGVAANQPGRVVYVVTPTRFEPSIDQLRQQFLQPTNRMMAMLMGGDEVKILSEFYQNIDRDAGFTSVLEEEQP